MPVISANAIPLRLQTAEVGVDWLQCNIECQEGCPVNTNCRGYLMLAAEGRFEEGYILARDPNPVAAICGYVCSAPCEKACRRADIDRHPERVEQVFLREPVVGALVRGRHAALVDEKDARLPPVDPARKRGPRESVEEDARSRSAGEGEPEDSAVGQGVRRRGGELQGRGPGRFLEVGQHANLETGRSLCRQLLHFPSVRQRRPSFSRNRSDASGPSVPAVFSLGPSWRLPVTQEVA